MPEADALALEAALLADLEAVDAADWAELLRLASSEDRELAAEPVAVDSWDWMDEARLLPSEVMDDRADETRPEAEDRADEISEPMEEVRLATELRAEVSVEAVGMLMVMPDSVVVDSWAYW